VKAVKVTAKKGGAGHIQYIVTIPKRFAEELGIESNDILFVEIRDIEVDGVKRRALVYYKP
jgi:bifunctional DNA-binding transcriptional regulator/antitoxin component of YhaV-PrlF toxin-antitoxin module